MTTINVIYLSIGSLLISLAMLIVIRNIYHLLKYLRHGGHYHPVFFIQFILLFIGVACLPSEVQQSSTWIIRTLLLVLFVEPGGSLFLSGMLLVVIAYVLFATTLLRITPSCIYIRYLAYACREPPAHASRLPLAFEGKCPVCARDFARKVDLSKQDERESRVARLSRWRLRVNEFAPNSPHYLGSLASLSSLSENLSEVRSSIACRDWSHKRWREMTRCISLSSTKAPANADVTFSVLYCPGNGYLVFERGSDFPGTDRDPVKQLVPMRESAQLVTLIHSWRSVA